MFHRSNPFHFGARAILGVAALLVLTFAAAGNVMSSAQAARVTIEFRTALDPYGHWRRHDRWGEVWVPADVDRGWRPYTVGHWVYSEDYGWYWVADRREARWGWVVYHYGRWVRDREFGWVWVPDNEWAPAWVSWRRGHRHIGWAPLPPQRLVVAYRDEPDVWIFVRAGDFTAPRIATVLLRPEPIFVRETVLVNRTVSVVDSGGFAVNPGIAPAVVSAVIGAPLRTYRVRPRVLAGTAVVPNAVTVQASELKRQDAQAAEAVVQETRTTIEPSKGVPEPKALADKENGRLGDNPPKAARQAAAQDQEKEAAGQSAEQEEGSEQLVEKSAEQTQGEEPASKSANQKPGDESGKKTAGKRQGDDSAEKSAVKDQSDNSAKKAAEQRKANESRAKAAKDSSAGDKPEGNATGRQQGREAKDRSAGQDRRRGREAADQKQRRAPAADKADAQKKGDGRAQRKAQQAAPRPAGKPETAGQAPRPAAKSTPAPQGYPGKSKGNPGKGKK